MRPEETFERVDTIPNWHMPGTHWYHPHWHGSTGIQAGSCVAGAIIVEDTPGYLPPAVADLEEIPLIMCPIQPRFLHTFATDFTEDSCFKTCTDDGYTAEQCSKDPGGACHDGVWGVPIPDDAPDVILLTNGRVNPIVTVVANRWYRIRLVYGAEEQALELGNSLPGCELQLLAKDGVYLPTAPRPIKSAFLGPGNRADLLIRCSAGIHPLNSGPSDFENSTQAVCLSPDLNCSEPFAEAYMETLCNGPCRPDIFSKNLPWATWTHVEHQGKFNAWNAEPLTPPGSTLPPLATILAVDQGEVPTELPKFEVNRPCYLVDLRGQTAAETTHIGFRSCMNTSDACPGGRGVMHDVDTTRFEFQIGHSGSETDPLEPWGGPHHSQRASEVYFKEPYIDVGTLHEFVVRAAANWHVLHIHVNPFQLQHTLIGPYADYFQSGDWHDVLLYPLYKDQEGLIGVPPEEGGALAKIMMQADYFNGTMIAHCHILHHEDQGMMANYKIAGPEGALWNGAESVDPKCYRGSSKAGGALAGPPVIL